MTRKIRKPFNPAARTRRREVLADEHRPPHEWGADPAALTLSANADVDALCDARGQVVWAHRSDVFEVLHGRGSLNEAELTAARRLQEDIVVRSGLFAPERTYVLVDSDGAREQVTVRMLEAGRRVDAVLSAVGPRQALLLRALMEPGATAGGVISWREVVARETRETNLHVQSAMVRSACDNLHLAYQAIDAAPRRRRPATSCRTIAPALAGPQPWTGKTKDRE